MTRYRHELPQLGGGLFLTDGGIETTLMFREGFDLPYFAAFPLLRDPEGRAALQDYFARYAHIATRIGAGLVLEAPTWRASSDWGKRLGYGPADLAAVNVDAISLLEDVRGALDERSGPIVLSGCLGPRGDGYVAAESMSAVEAQAYHSPQVETFARSTADMVCALTMTNVAEAIGIARAAEAVDLPVAISFTAETDGRLPAGDELAAAIEAVDAATAAYPSYYMVNCVHPTHLAEALPRGPQPWWATRLRGLRANASRKSHAELNEATELDAGDPWELALEYDELMDKLPALTVLGGCCGTDERHIECIASTCGPRIP